MAEEAFENVFQTAVTSRGEAYREAKEAILALADEERRAALAELHRRASSANRWEETLTARILAGWMERPEDFERCAAYAHGELPGPEPLAGFTARHRAVAISQIGPEVTPRVLEMVYKDPQAREPRVQASLFGALVYLEDPLAVPPMIALVEEEDADPGVREQAMNVLSRLGDPRGLEPLLRLTEDADAEASTRETAIRALAGFEDPRASERLLAILADENRSPEEHHAAATALFLLASPATVDGVRALVRQRHEARTLVYLIGLLGQLGGPEDLPLLEELAASDDPEVAEEATDAIESLSEGT